VNSGPQARPGNDLAGAGNIYAFGRRKKFGVAPPGALSLLLPLPQLLDTPPALGYAKALKRRGPQFT